MGVTSGTATGACTPRWGLLGQPTASPARVPAARSRVVLGTVEEGSRDAGPPLAGPVASQVWAPPPGPCCHWMPPALRMKVVTGVQPWCDPPAGQKGYGGVGAQRSQLGGSPISRPLTRNTPSPWVLCFSQAPEDVRMHCLPPSPPAGLGRSGGQGRDPGAWAGQLGCTPSLCPWNSCWPLSCLWGWSFSDCSVSAPPNSIPPSLPSLATIGGKED